MNVTLVLLIVLFAVLAVIGVPLALALGLSTFVSLALTTDMLLVVIAQKVQLGADSYLMMAVPLFILAANIMNYSGVTERIFRFARAIVGSMPGALGHANVVASVVSPVSRAPPSQTAPPWGISKSSPWRTRDIPQNMRQPLPWHQLPSAQSSRPAYRWSFMQA